MTPVVAVGAIVVDDDHLLMVRRGRGPAAGDWSIPGGRVETGETLAEAVVRELREETGIEGVCDAFAGWIEQIQDDYHHVILDFWVTLLDAPGMAVPVPGDDAAEVRWVTLSDVSSLNLAEGLAEFLHDQGVITAIT